jgi:hypothetical protein
LPRSRIASSDRGRPFPRQLFKSLKTNVVVYLLDQSNHVALQEELTLPLQTHWRWCRFSRELPAEPADVSQCQRRRLCPPAGKHKKCRPHYDLGALEHGVARLCAN